MSRPINLTIDANSRKITKYQDLIKLYDSLSLSITVLDGVAPYNFAGKTVEVFLKKSDNTKVEQAAIISGNVVNIATLSNQSSSQVGQVEGELIISDATGQITSSTFIYQVEGTISGEILVESHDDVQLLDDIKERIDNYNLNADNLAIQNTQATQNISTLTQKNSDAIINKTNLDKSINDAKAFASTYSDIANAQVNIVNLNYVKDAAAELIRESTPSGFTTLSDLDYTYMSTNPNTIKTLADSVAFVNGYKVTIPKGTVITLDAPPTSGSRDDLVFLEAWKQTDASGAITWNWRLRVVSGVDFSTYPEGFHRYSQAWTTSEVTPQGGNTAPIVTTGANNSLYNYCNAVNPSNRNFPIIDVGLYFSGDGTSASKTALGTTDGYVYAIPMFRIHRRNSGGYSVNNANGSTLLIGTTITADTVIGSNVISLGNVSNISVGDYIYSINSLYTGEYRRFKVLGIDSANKKVTVDKTLTGSMGANNAVYIIHGEVPPYFNAANRAVPAFADIIVDRDIIDLRHQVSLTGFNYSQLLEENFDKLLRGELQTNAKTNMIKHYHGVPKTPIDANTVFYASLDGTTVAEVGSYSLAGGGISQGTPNATGLSANLPSGVKLVVNTGISSGSVTIDAWIKKPTGAWQIGLMDNDIYIDAYAALGPIYMRNNTGGGSPTSLVMTTDLIHIRLRIIPNDKMYFYINGNLAGSKAITNITNYTVAVRSVNTPTLFISDLSISNIDRGAIFATLPQDFIDGYARISPAFNEQRNVFSDALTSETDFVQVKATGGNGKAITTTQATSGVWANADKVKVKGIGGEIITGVIDADTALCRIVSFDDGTISNTKTAIKVDDVSKLSANDTIKLLLNGVVVDVEKTITAIDTANKILTLNLAISTSDITQFLIIESTTSSSAPTVKYLNGATLTDVTGTWSGLGTNEATFTLGTNASLTTQDLYVTYSLNEVAGQGGISEVLTTVLAGESNGKKLTVNPTVHVRDDFAGKVSGDTVVCPNIMKVATGETALRTPSFLSIEMSQGGYTGISTLNGASAAGTSNANGAIPQQLFSFNLIRILEDKFGPLPCGSDLASKIAYAKANIKSVTGNWWGYGSGPSGNKVYLDIFDATANVWAIKNAGAQNSYSNSANTSSLISYALSNALLQYRLDNNGFVHFLAYTEPSDGITASTVYSNYANIEITLNTSAGYDVLAPENPRRDDGKANILLVRKETKEIQSMFSRSNADGVVTYGDYVPYQGLAPTISYTDATLSVKAKNKNFIGDVGTGGYKSALTGIKESQLPTGVNRSYYMNSNNIGYFKLEDINNLISVNNNDLVNLLVDILRSYNSNSLGNLFASSATKKLRGFSFNHQTPRYIDVSNLLSKFNLSVNSYIITGLVVSYQGNLYLVIARSDVNGDKTVWFGNSSTNAAVDVFYMPNRPLIK